MFSKRLPVDRTPNLLSRALAAHRTAGRTILDLTESNPTRAGFVYPAGLLDAFRDVSSLVYEPAPAGVRAARTAIAEYYATGHGCRVDPDAIVVTTSTSEAYAWLFKLLADAGDQVLVPQPSYPLFEMLGAMESVRIATYPLVYDGAWHIDLDSLAAAITPVTRAIVVVNPNNPTGTFLKQHEVRGLLQLCLRHDVALISDEVFADYRLGIDEDRVTTVAVAHSALVFALGGLSKIAALPQVKLGWIVCAGQPVLRDDALARLDLIADTYLSVSTAVQIAAPRLLGTRTEVQCQIRKRTALNLSAARAAVELHPAAGCRVLHTEGGWYAVVQVPATKSDEAWALDLLEHDGVSVHPGFFFDFDRGAFCVVSLLTPEALFADGISRLVQRVAIDTT